MPAFQGALHLKIDGVFTTSFILREMYVRQYKHPPSASLCSHLLYSVLDFRKIGGFPLEFQQCEIPHSPY